MAQRLTIEVPVNRRNLALVSILCGVILLMLASAHPLGIRAQSPNRAGLVVVLGDGSVVARCVEFVEGEISGYDLLMRSGLQVVAAQSGGIGVTICEIGGEGCPASNCFCKCSGSTCTYWTYWHLAGGEWSYSSIGANGHRLGPGDVDGWTWGTGDPPPVLLLDQICALPDTATPLPTVTPTPVPTDTPTLLPTATATLPTHTPQRASTTIVLPTATQTFTSVPSATPTGVATLQRPTTTPSATFAGEATQPLPTPTPGLATLAAGSQDREGRSNYVLFAVLVVILLGVIVVMVLLRKR